MDFAKNSHSIHNKKNIILFKTTNFNQHRLSQPRPYAEHRVLTVNASVKK